MRLPVNQPRPEVFFRPGEWYAIRDDHTGKIVALFHDPEDAAMFSKHSEMSLTAIRVEVPE